ncbi:MAG: 50S ribosomal protein L3 N(5)-glutamine methyltransferase, partial [Idiomarina sp.]|nr:50S ribosomal protein L3 N(5)-glutamine methyltransferase [Idiomarina sp.]
MDSEATQQAVNELHTIDDILRWSVSQMGKAGTYFGHGYANAVEEARALLGYVLSLTPDELIDMRHCRLTQQ